MPKKDDNLDPVVVAALVEDSGEDEKDKEIRAKALKDAEEADDEVVEDQEDDDDEEKDEPKKSSKKPAGKSEDDKSEDEDDPKDPKQKSDVKSDDDELTDEEKAEQERQSRKERREERRKKWQESLKQKPQPKSNPLLQADPNYKPLDYEAQDEFKTDELKRDRELAMQNALAQGAEIERRIQEQERFWDRTDMEDQILRYNPDLQFLNPDNKEAYNPKRADAVLQSFLQAIGYKEEPLYDPTTRQPLIDPETGQQRVRATVQRTDIGWKDYAEGYVANMEEWLDEEMSERSNEIVAQQSRQGIRPGGSSKRGKPQLRPGMFRDMSDEEFDRMDEETDEAILSAF